jgi:hypothetical protein
MTVPLSEAFIASSESSLGLISCLLRVGVICRLLGPGSDVGAEGAAMKLSGAARSMETMDEDSEADQQE